MIRHPSRVLLTLAFLALPEAAATAATVSGLTASHAAGQTFLRWQSPPGTGWTFHVYRAETEPPPGSGLSGYEWIGDVGDSTWCDRRLSGLGGATRAFVLPGFGELTPGDGMFAYTCSSVSEATYAVTCEASGVPADTVLTPGQNLTEAPVAESAAPPEPHFQRTVQVTYGQYSIFADVYTLWTSDRSTPFAPAMCNRPSVPFDCAIRVNPGGGAHALMFTPHPRGGSFLQLNHGSSTPGEYVLTMDDHLAAPEQNTFWFGYREDYDITGAGPPASGETAADYTMRRVIHTIEWARRAFPIDTTRVYVAGNSMGGIGGAFLSLRRPDLIAAAMLTVPLFDFTFDSDPNVACAFNVGGGQRIACDRLWGPPQWNARTPEGEPVYDLLNGNRLVERLSGTWVPPIVAFSGRNDTTIGWAEKPLFYATMQSTRSGGRFFFDTRTHGGSSTSQWGPLERFADLYRFRTNRSFPAFSDCSADSDPGDGNATSGDSVGTINGFLDWAPDIADFPDRWTTRIFLTDLAGRFQTFHAPESLTVTITPRRVQAFKPPPGSVVRYELVRYETGETFESGEIVVDPRGLMSLAGVKVYRGGTQVVLTTLETLDVAAGTAPSLSLRVPAVPVRGSFDAQVSWPAPGPARVEMFDLGGRRLRVRSATVAASGPQTLRWDLGGLPAGLYFLRAEQSGRSVVRRVILTP